jgi:hypothetical protein
MGNDTASSTTLETLNALLRSERTAADSYRRALRAVADPAVTQQLEECRRSHDMRVDVLCDEIDELGGEPGEDSGLWQALSDQEPDQESTLRALADGEGRETALYLRDAGRLADEEARELIELELLPEQQRTQRIAKTLTQRRV